jgi:hypothetical protein
MEDACCTLQHRLEVSRCEVGDLEPKRRMVEQPPDGEVDYCTR